MKTINKLTWKYFLKQKWDETKGFWKGVGVVVLLIFIPYLIGLFFHNELSTMVVSSQFTSIIFKYWFLGFILIVLLIIIGFILVVIREMTLRLVNWLKSNWKEARRKARREMK